MIEFIDPSMVVVLQFEIFFAMVLLPHVQVGAHELEREHSIDGPSPLAPCEVVLQLVLVETLAHVGSDLLQPSAYKHTKSKQ